MATGLVATTQRLHGDSALLGGVGGGDLGVQGAAPAVPTLGLCPGDIPVGRQEDWALSTVAAT